jgi:hypothetical protein
VGPESVPPTFAGKKGDESNMLQLISVLGALAILGVYAASQFGLVDASKLSYQVATFLGNAALAVVAVIDPLQNWLPAMVKAIAPQLTQIPSVVMVAPRDRLYLPLHASLVMAVAALVCPRMKLPPFAPKAALATPTVRRGSSQGPP